MNIESLVQQHGFHGLSKEAKRWIMSEKCFALVLEPTLPEACQGRFISVLAEMVHVNSFLRATKVIVTRGDETKKFLKATSLYIGVGSFFCYIQNFQDGVFLVAPLCEKSHSNFRLGSMAASIDVDPLSNPAAYLELFLTSVSCGVLPAAKLGDEPTTRGTSSEAETSISTSVLQSFSADVFNHDSEEHVIVVFVTEKCPLCPSAVALVTSVLQRTASRLDSDLPHPCPLRFTAFKYNVDKNDVIAHPDCSPEAALSSTDISSVPLIRLYPAGRRHDHRDFRGPRETAQFGAFLQQSLTLCEGCPLVLPIPGSTCPDVEISPACVGRKCCYVLPHVKRPRDVG